VVRNDRYDVAVIGAGIAGITLAAQLSADRRVVLVEQEAHIASHTTGRSAAMFIESYGSPEIRVLTVASRADFDAACDDPDNPPLLRPRGLVWCVRAHQRGQLDDLLVEVPSLKRLDASALTEVCPAIKANVLVAGALETQAQDIDVGALVQHNLRRGRAWRMELITGARVVSAERYGGGWRVITDAGGLEAEVVVVAAGAWSDHVAGLFGARPVGLRPLRRTIVVARAGAIPIDPEWPLVCALDESFYFRSEGPNVLLSPADETPSGPCDARPEELDVALGIARINEATKLEVRSVLSAWAGLRTFAPDRNPVVGHDPDVEGLFWLAGQGGSGIQTAPAIARLAATLLRGEPMPPDVAGVDIDRLSPGRFTTCSSRSKPFDPPLRQRSMAAPKTGEDTL
jgi:D-arginine dehydrogenase